MKSAEYWIDKLHLQLHPEGGSFREIYRSEDEETFKTEIFKNTEKRPLSTAIYFLLKSEEFSCFHRLKSDEVWHFYDGAPLTIYQFEKDGNLRRHFLGKEIELGQNFQIVVPKNHWFAAQLTTQNSFALVGCTMAPGFHFDDFEIAKRPDLIARFPMHEALISRLTLPY